MLSSKEKYPLQIKVISLLYCSKTHRLIHIKENSRGIPESKSIVHTITTSLSENQ